MSSDNEEAVAIGAITDAHAVDEDPLPESCGTLGTGGVGGLESLGLTIVEMVGAFEVGAALACFAAAAAAAVPGLGTGPPGFLPGGLPPIALK